MEIPIKLKFRKLFSKLRMGKSKNCQSLTVRAPLIAVARLPSLGGVNVAGTPWTLVVINWYSRSTVVLSRLSQRVSVSLMESNDCLEAV